MSKKIKKFKEHFEDEEHLRIREQRKPRASEKTALRNAVKNNEWLEFEDDWDDEQDSDYYR